MDLHVSLTLVRAHSEVNSSFLPRKHHTTDPFLPVHICTIISLQACADSACQYQENCGRRNGMLWPGNVLSSLISFRYSLALISEEGGTTGDTYGKRKKGKY